MGIMAGILCATAITCFAIGPTLANPLSEWPATTGISSVQHTRLACDEYGRCWETGSGFGLRGSQPGYRYNPYSGYEYGPPVRPSTNWEQRGFCPPGQAKNG